MKLDVCVIEILIKWECSKAELLRNDFGKFVLRVHRLANVIFDPSLSLSSHVRLVQDL